MLQSSRGPEMERTKFMQVVMNVELTFQNLSLVGTETGKQAEWSCEAFNVPPVLEQQLMSDPFAVE